MSRPARRMIFGLMTLCPLAVGAQASGDDPAAHQVQVLDDSLLRSMHAGAKESVADHYRQLEPVIQEVFDLPQMARLSVGPVWTTFSGEQQRAIVTAFIRLTIAGYAHNFQVFAGEKFSVDAVSSRGTDKIVQTRISADHDAPVNVIYRERESGGSWKIIDVYYDGISELTMHRSDFGAAITAGGAAGLVAHLDKLSDQFMRQ